MERRWHHRTEIDIPAMLAVIGKHRSVPCRIRNVSAGGLFIETPESLARHQFIQVHIDPHGVSPRVIEGMVVHVEEGGVGVEAENRFWSRMIASGDSAEST